MPSADPWISYCHMVYGGIERDKTDKRCLECHWKKMKMLVRTAIKVYLVTIHVVKQNYFCAQIASVNNHPKVIFKVTQVPLVRRSKFYLQGHAEEFADFLTDKVIQIHFQSDISVDTGQGKCLR